MVAISPARSFAPRPAPSVLAVRRLVAALALAAVIGALALVAGATVQHARSGPASLDGAGPGVQVDVRPVATRVHVVQPGDTLWAIARSFQPEGDVRPLVARLERAIGSGPLQPGQRLTVPVA